MDKKIGNTADNCCIADNIKFWGYVRDSDFHFSLLCRMRFEVNGLFIGQSGTKPAGYFKVYGSRRKWAVFGANANILTL